MLAYPINNGTVFVSGKKSSKQIFIKTNDALFQLSKFANWENIQSLYISPNEKYLIAYHRADKDNYYRITLYDLDLRIRLAETAPGMACFGIKWFIDNILFFTGTSGSGTSLFGYDYNLTKLFDINGPKFYIDLEEGICFSYPVYSAENGVFTVYDINNGAIKMKFDYGMQTNEDYVCDSVVFKGKRTYQLVLKTLKTNRNITVEKTFE